MDTFSAVSGMECKESEIANHPLFSVMSAFINAVKLALGHPNEYTNPLSGRNPLPKQENVMSYMKQ